MGRFILDYPDRPNVNTRAVKQEEERQKSQNPEESEPERERIRKT